MISRKQAYEDYLQDYRLKIDNMINKANTEQETRIIINKMPPKIIINELEKAGYELTQTIGDQVNPKYLIINWGE